MLDDRKKGSGGVVGPLFVLAGVVGGWMYLLSLIF